MAESELRGRVNFCRLREYFGRVNFGRVNFGRLRENFGRVNFGRVNFGRLLENLAELPWPTPTILGRIQLCQLLDDFGRIRMVWLNRLGRFRMAASKPRLLPSEISCTNRHQLVLGAPDSLAHAWEKTFSAGPCVRLIWACRGGISWAEVAWLWVSREKPFVGLEPTKKIIS